MKQSNITPSEKIEQRIFLLRGQKVMLSQHLAQLYGVPVKVLNQAVQRNLDRFPLDFMFQLDAQELVLLRSQIVTSNIGRGGRRYAPYAFTEQGVAMLSSVLRSKRAVHVNVEIMRAFVRLRQLLATHADLARKLESLEKKYDAQFKVVFDAIRELMTPAVPDRREIGFHTADKKTAMKDFATRRDITSFTRIKAELKAYGLHDLPLYLFHLACIYELRGHLDKAQTWFRHFLLMQSEFTPDKVDEINLHFLENPQGFDVAEAVKIARQKIESK